MIDRLENAPSCHPELACRRQAQRGICLFLAITFGAIFLSAAPSPPSRPRVLGIAGVRILVSNPKSSEAFYSKILGSDHPCHRFGDPRSTPFFCSVDPVQYIELWESSQTLPANLIREIVFATDDVSALRKYVATQSIQLLAPIVRSDDPNFQLSVADPEGHRIGFVQLPTDAVKEFSHDQNGRLIHAGFIVRDRAATEHFYKDILGFRPYWHGGMKDDGKDEWVSMQVPDGTDWLEFMINVSPDADQRLRGIMNHIAIGVTDIHETEKRLKDAGVPLTEEPKIGRDGKWQLNVYDPDLTRIEFMEFKPVQKPCCSDFTGPHPQPSLVPPL